MCAKVAQNHETDEQKAKNPSIVFPRSTAKNRPPRSSILYITYNYIREIPFAIEYNKSCFPIAITVFYVAELSC